MYQEDWGAYDRAFNGSRGNDYDRRVRPARYSSGRPRKVYRSEFSAQYTVPRKRSGAKFGTYVNAASEKRDYVKGWMVRQKTLVSIICVPCNDIKTKSPDNEKWVAKVSYNNGHKPETMTAFYNVKSRKVTIPDLQIVLNPNAPNGGFTGSFFKRKR